MNLPPITPGVTRGVKRCFNALGLEIRRHRPVSAEFLNLNAVLQHLSINLVLDVGANAGQYAVSIRRAGYQGRIVSFEPLSDAHSALQSASIGDPNWQVHDRCAIGAAAGSAEINIAANSISSSILPMLAAHSDAAPDSTYHGRESTVVQPLDAVVPLYRRPGDNVFLKIDTQGFEAQVLDGATRSLAHVQAIQVELSLVPLYDGQQLWDYFIERLRTQGFEIHALYPGFTDLTSGQLLQFDAVLCRRR